MKKILSLVLVVVMLMSMTVTAFAAGEQSGTSTVTAVVPDPEYTIHIPADMTLEYGNGARQLVGEVFVTNVQNLPDEKSIFADMDATPLKSTEGNVIPAVFEYRRDFDEEGYFNIDAYNPAVCSQWGEDSDYTTVYLYATVTAADWEAAKPGTYTSTITYEFIIG